MTRFVRAERVTILTGAGVSAESGVPTFRGGGGSAVWKGIPFDRVSSREMLSSDPITFWEWFNYRRAILSRVRPNPAHYALAGWQQRFKSLTLITQNIDDLHHVAGSKGVLELHGNIWRVRCIDCDRVSEHRKVPIDSYPPRCPCGGMLRPDVVLFGEALPIDVMRRAMERASDCDLFFVVGTSAVVHPAAQLPLLAKEGGAFLIEVNPEPTVLSRIADATLVGKAGELLPQFGDSSN